MADDTNRFSLHTKVPTHAWGVYGKWYSLTGAERPNQPIRQGEFRLDYVVVRFYCRWRNICGCEISSQQLDTILVDGEEEYLSSFGWTMSMNLTSWRIKQFDAEWWNDWLAPDEEDEEEDEEAED
ncbi:hypothetical protein AJ80_07238 [Polytolypa hystricis UAMH7299]|uniref:Uncharacterized protein n=1 Tax=Polytolypa hystricis (strain UAMH7299) TaxID=1447883 RepID=A0A2B7XPR0_POLH7|nr:hypothetical protein AJ80_07238 [Polytolypa hystricis UAMH7299]